MQEIWKDIPEHEGLYQASNLGNIKSLNYNHTWVPKLLSQFKDKDWYFRVSMYWKDKKQNQLQAHRMVALTFIGVDINKPQVNHINWIKDDNRVDNLEWCTAQENSIHRNHVLWYKTPKYWLWKKWKDNHSSKVILQFSITWEFLKEWDSMSDITRELWIFASWISNVCTWKLKTSWGFIWKFKV